MIIIPNNLLDYRIEIFTNSKNRWKADQIRDLKGIGRT